MGENQKRATVKDVARIAGVSIGTVDRVLHDRGEVSQKSKERVLKVIEEIGYKPNIYASMLASNKEYHIYCLIPQMQEGEYWGLARNGISRAEKENAPHNISVHILEFDQFDADSFCRTCHELVSKEMHGAVLVPMYPDDTTELTKELNKRNIPYVYIDSKVKDEQYLAYYGMPMYESGSLAASLLAGEGLSKEIACIGIERGNSISDNTTMSRKEGFMAYLAEHSPETKVHNVLLFPYDTPRNTQILDTFFRQHPEVRDVITFNSRIYLIAEYLKQSGLQNYRLLGFDMLERNVSALKEGYIRYLIAQHTETQLYQSINSLAHMLTLNTPPESRDNYMPMDIIIKENVDFYKDI